MSTPDRHAEWSRRIPDLAAELADVPFRRVSAPWAGHEHSEGYAVMILPMSQGDLLGLRVFPRSDFGGYVSVWHRPPGKGWSQYVDGAPLEHGCPRVWGPALEHADRADISVSWTGSASMTVTMDRPALTWRLDLDQSPALAVLNMLHARLPLATWRAAGLVRAREWVARWLGLGPVALSGVAPTGAHLVAVLRRLYWVRDSRATLAGRDLGRPRVLRQCPTIDGWPLPRRGVFAIGGAHATTVPPDRIRLPGSSTSAPTTDTR